MLRGFHKLCDKARWEEARASLKEKNVRDVVAKPSGRGNWTPLHLACKRDAPEDFISSLIEVAPSTVELFDSSHRLPIHYAAEKGTSEVLRVLREAYAPSICQTDKEGRTPLHIRILSSSREYGNNRLPPSREEMGYLLDADSIVARTVSNDGNLPLHLVCNSIDHFSEESLRVLVRSFVQATLEKNGEGLSPIHQALLRFVDTPPTLLHLNILMVLDEVVHLKDKEGRLPLHCACQNFSSYDNLSAILNRNTEAAGVPMKDGRYPIHIIEEMREEIEVDKEEIDRASDMLFAYHPDVLPFRMDIERLERLVMGVCEEVYENQSLSEISLMFWTWMCTFPEMEDSDHFYFSIIASTVRSLGPESARALITIEAPNGSQIFEIASPQYTALFQSYLRFADKYEFSSESHGIKVGSSLSVQVYDYPEEDADTRGTGTNSREVVLTFMSSREDFLNETNFQSKLVLKENEVCPTLPILESYDIDRIGTENETAGDQAFVRDLGSCQFLDLSDYRCAIVRPAHGETLQDILSKRDDLITRKVLMKKLGRSLACLNRNGIYCGEFKLNAIIEFGESLVFRDLSSACASLGVYHGSEFSSGFLPPEMVAELNFEEVEMYFKYWKCVIDDAKIVRLIFPDDKKSYFSSCQLFSM